MREGAQGTRDVAAAFQRNTNIAKLNLVGLGDFLDPVLEGLVSHSSLRELVLGRIHLKEETSNLLQGLLESSTGSIQHLGLNGTILHGTNHSVLLPRGSLMEAQ